jgi:Variant SH3 domain
VNEEGARENPLSRSMELSALFSEEVGLLSAPPRRERTQLCVEVRVMFRFRSEDNPSLLELCSGETLVALEPHSAEWWLGRKRRGSGSGQRTGLFPAAYTTMHDNPIFKQIRISSRWLSGSESE